MNASRREAWGWLAAFFAATAAAADEVLPSKVYRFQDLPARGQSRPVLRGRTHTGFPIEIHETELPPGVMPHPPHRHPHEEVFFIREGTVEVTIDGTGSRLGPGSVAYIASNARHGIRNVGATEAQYFVLALGTDGLG
jgi:quercetin dioxygenase-like cupin family protein